MQGQRRLQIQKEDDHSSSDDDDDDRTKKQQQQQHSLVRRSATAVPSLPLLLLWFLQLLSLSRCPLTDGFSVSKHPLAPHHHHRPWLLSSSYSTTTLLWSSVDDAPTTNRRRRRPSQTKKEDVFDADKEAANAKRAQQRHQQQKSNANNNNSASNALFFDTARLHVAGGDGGTGCVAFLREKGAPRMGPSGGRGGRGGSVYLECDIGLRTLLPVRQRVHRRAKSGKNGLGKHQNGAGAKNSVVMVPMGTVVRDLRTQKVAGELRVPGERLLVAKGGRGGRGNAAFETSRRTSPKLAERGEPGTERWLSLELQLVADVGFLGMPNAGKSTLLASSSQARPKIADYPFTTIVPNLGVCDVPNSGGEGLVLCDIPGLIRGAADGAGMGGTFLRHVQRSKVLLHVVDGTSEDPVGDFNAIQAELLAYDTVLAEKPQVVVLNKVDVTDVAERQEELLKQLRAAAGHTRVMAISAATTAHVRELMGRLRKFVDAQPEAEPPLPPQIDLSKAGLDYDSDDFSIQSDPSYPGQWRVTGEYVEQVARMTHWEYPEAVERFGRQLDAMGIADELLRRGAQERDLIMIDEYDFDFAPGLTSPYIPDELLERDDLFYSKQEDTEENEEAPWRPFQQGGFMDVDTEELIGFDESEDWDLLEENDFDEDGEFVYEEDDDVWTS